MGCSHVSRCPKLTLLTLVLCTTLGPLSIDLFIPSLPTIGSVFGANAATVQWTISIFMLGFAISMLIVGPLADRFGRKQTLITGYIIYLLATLFILFTTDIWLLITARFIQAIFGCFGTALARTMIRELFDGKQQVKMIALTSACIAITPTIAPIIGGIIAALFGWQANFIVMLLVGTLIMTMVIFFMPNTRTQEQDTTSSVATPLLERFATVIADRHYRFYALLAAVSFAGVFVLIAAAPFVFINHLGFTTQQFGYCIAIMITGFVIGNSLASRFTEYFDIQQVLNITFIVMALGASIAFTTGLAFVNGLISIEASILGYIIGMFLYELGLGIFIPACQTSALQYIKHNVSTASGLITFAEMTLAALVSYLAGQLPHNTTFALTWVSMGAVVIIGFMLLAYRRKNDTKQSTSIPSASSF